MTELVEAVDLTRYFNLGRNQRVHAVENVSLSVGEREIVCLIGQSGSGKTTLTRKIVHQIHTMGEEYVVKWFNGHEMLHMDDHIKNMQVGTPHIMIFDDASYTLEDAKKADIAKLANALTTIRHTLKSRVIVRAFANFAISAFLASSRV
jgi:ABC-type glutathione transport system ATPase component